MSMMHDDAVHTDDRDLKSEGGVFLYLLLQRFCGARRLSLRNLQTEQ